MKNSEPKISIIIPTYNGEKYITNTINSLKNQTYKNYEVIIVDDCSKDNTCKIIENAILNDNRFKLYKRDKNQGNAVKNIEWAIQFLKSDLFFYMSQDDLIDSDFFEKCIQKTIETGADAVVPNMYYYYPNVPPDSLNGIFPSDKDYNKEYSNTEAFKLSLNWQIHAFHLKRMSIVKELSWNSHLLAGDEILNRLYFYYSNKVVYVDTNFYYNQENEDGITRKIKPSLLEYAECALKVSEFAYKTKNIDKNTKKLSNKRAISELKIYTSIIKNNHHKLSDEQKSEIKTYLKHLRKIFISYIFKTKNYFALAKVIKYTQNPF